MVRMKIMTIAIFWTVNWRLCYFICSVFLVPTSLPVDIRYSFHRGGSEVQRGYISHATSHSWEMAERWLTHMSPQLEHRLCLWILLSYWKREPSKDWVCFCFVLFFRLWCRLCIISLSSLFSRKDMDYTVDRTWFFPYFDQSSELCVNQWITWTNGFCCAVSFGNL